MLTGIQYFSLQRLSGRVFWAFVVLASLMLLTGIGANFSLDQAETSNTRQISRLRQVTDVNTLRAYLYEETNTLNLIILYKVNGVVEYTGLNTIRTKATIEQMSQDFPEGDEANGSFSSILSLYSDITNRFSAAVNKKLSAQEEADLYNQVKKDYDSLTGQVNELLNSRQQAADTARNNYLALVNSTRLAYVIISMVLFILALFFAYLVARLLASPLARLTSQLRLIATGNLSKQMELKGSDEVLELSFIFNRTIFNLKNAIARIQQQVKNIGQASQQIIDSSDSQVANLTEQAEAVAETSTTAVQLSDTGEQIAESAEQVAASANFALASANRCYELMLSTNETMNEIREKANQTALTILSLNEVAQRIRDVSILIDNFSNETHLLALNAAIESAGAGVEGERFAVVAGHVRRLAQRSKVAAVEIQQLVRQIQQSAITSVMATEESTKVAEIGEKRVLESLQANEIIVAQISQTAQLAEAISLATQQQRSASSLVASRMLRLNEISNSISLSGQAYVASANRLGEVVNELNAVVSSFVVDELAATLLGPDSESLMTAALPAYSAT